MPAVITARISVLGTGRGVDTRGLQADSCMGSFSIKGCLGKEEKKKSSVAVSPEGCLPRAWGLPGVAGPRHSSACRENSQHCAQLGAACRILPCSGCISKPEEKAQEPQQASGFLERLTFCKFFSLSRGEPYSSGEWARIPESYRIGFEPEF